MDDELWLPVLGAPGYDVSDAGRIKGPRGILKPSRLNSGYLGVKVGGKGTTVHAVVASAFIGQRPTSAHTVNHKNGDKHDNRPANLEWMTQAENNKHAVEVLGRQNGRPARPKPIDRRAEFQIDMRSAGYKLLDVKPRRGISWACVDAATGEVLHCAAMKSLLRWIARQCVRPLAARNFH